MNDDGPRVGAPAPDFDLPRTRIGPDDASRARLDEYRGRWLALLFYPRDFSMLCPTELTGLSARIDDFRAARCELLGVSTDSIADHERWLATPRERGGLRGLKFPIASDADGRASRDYRVYDAERAIALRGLFLIDPEGLVQYQVVHNLSVGRRTEEVLRVLAALQSGGLCPHDWDADGAVLDPTMVLGPGSVVGHYRIEEQIGAGSFAAVFRAADVRLDRSVALKILKPGTTMTPASVLAEARIAAALNHPNVCTVYSVDDGEGVPMIAMEYLDGQTLDALIREGSLSAARSAELASQVASGMAAAHARGVVHGDLKPQNVFVTHEGVAKILDFGLAQRPASRSVDPFETIEVAPSDDGEGMFGTPGYMAPEQARGAAASAKSDVFAVGAILYEMLTGRKAFPGRNVLQVLDQIRNVKPGSLAAELPDPFSTIVRRALEPDPAERTITMRDLAERLAQAVPRPEPSAH